MSSPDRSLSRSLPWLLAAALALLFVGWGRNVPVAAWLAPLFLLRFFRLSPGAWWLLALPVASASMLGVVWGGWDMSVLLAALLSSLATLPLVGALALDRLLATRLEGLARTLVLPAAWAVGDWLFAFMPGLGAVFSPAPTQLANLPLAQVAALTGIWGLTFLLGWGASTVHEVLEQTPRWRRSAGALGAVLLVALAWGGWRTHALDRSEPTVRVGTVTVEHPGKYWDDILDRGVPAAEQARWEPELLALEDALFAESLVAVQGGAQVVLWSEGAAVLYESHEAAFTARAEAFARQHGVWLLTGGLVMRHGDPVADNNAVFVSPEDGTQWEYLKTQSWYPTASDGTIHASDTPFGRLASVICFDADFPRFVRKAARARVDLLLVPGFDTEPISPYHTQVSVMRAIEGGYSMVRAVNHGTSMAVDATGRTLALQDHFRTDSRVMLADVPTRRRTTLYGMLGDWFPVTALLGLVALAVVARRRA